MENLQSYASLKKTRGGRSWAKLTKEVKVNLKQSLGKFGNSSYARVTLHSFVTPATPPSKAGGVAGVTKLCWLYPNFVWVAFLLLLTPA